MQMSELRDMYAYNYWANYHLLDMAENLTPEQFTAESTHSYSSVQRTLLHTLETEWTWRLLLQGRDFRQPELQPADFPAVESIRERWRTDEAEMWAYLDSLHDEDLTGIIRYTGDTGIHRERVLWHCLFHLVNHGMQHRSEISHMLTGFGHSPGEIDFTIFLNVRAGQPNS